MEHEETLVALARTMKVLPERHRQVIMLYYFHNRRLSENAEAFKAQPKRAYARFTAKPCNC